MELTSQYPNTVGITHIGIFYGALNWLRDAPNSLTFNNCTFCPNCIYVFCICLRTNSDLCHLRHKLIGFNSRDGKCLLRGTDWAFKYFMKLEGTLPYSQLQATRLYSEPAQSSPYTNIPHSEDPT
jgi:hypothetical protein